ncbi:response regulator transcription factor [Frankia sp. Cr1]|uniref:response regulator transcription factor n=1 Tax=Frankia sp. Cr1 TaxID=3073931 RepID=UPI002AD2D45F|nr:response regulator transcription factor [Frankia sp. Cr1]
MRLILADDSALFRRGLAALLHEAGHEIIAQHGDAETLLDSVAALDPDLVIVDIRMPPTGTTEGLRAAIQIREHHPHIGVLILSQYVETAQAVKLLSASNSGVGYLLKDRVGEITELTDALARISGGGTVIDSEVVTVLMGHQHRTGLLQRLTDREREVLELMAEGRSNAAISHRLFLSARTVETHVTAIFLKLDISLDANDNRRILAVLTHLRS